MRRLAAGAVAGLLLLTPGAALGRMQPAQPAMQPVIVKLRPQAALSGLPRTDRRTRLRALVTQLQQTADATQQPLLDLLASRRSQGLVRRVRPLWVFNGIAVTAAPSVLSELAARPDVESVTSDVTLAAPAATGSSPAEPNLSVINAAAAWSMGDTGQGIVVASLDTGVDLGHPDLAGRWRGGSNSWYDPYGQHATPADVNGHGTHTMGVMVGGDAGGSWIGVAPGATWISAKIFNDQGQATASAIHLSFQWLLDPDGNPATADAPQVVNNSWSMTAGCNLEFQPDIAALRAARILPVFAAGNSGPGSPSDYSPANNPGALAVGSTTNTDTIAYDSSRGPTSCGQPQTTYPSVVAPGVGIRSADLHSGYSSESGTSMAAPHVAGALALILSAHPTLTAAAQEAAITGTAVDLGASGPDNVFGHGRIDVLAALQSPATDTTGPDVGSVALSPDATTLTGTASDAMSAIAAAEWFEGADPGVGGGSPMTAADGSFDTTTETISGATGGLAPGQHTLQVRARDAAGNWGPATSLTVSVAPPDALFADGFASGDLTAWSGVKNAPALAVTHSGDLHGGDGYRLEATVTGARRSYLTDQTPASEPSYHARFYLDASLASTGGEKWILLAGFDAGGTRLFALQYRTGTGASSPQIRAVARSAGSQPATTWTALPPAAHAIEVAWQAAASGSVALWVDGVPAGSRNGLANSTRLESVRFGPSAGVGTKASGKLLLDDFASTRTTSIGP